MDQIRFEVRPHQASPLVTPPEEVAIFINGRSLVKLAEASGTRLDRWNLFELGRAVGLPPERAFPPSTYLLGEAIHGVKVPLLRCGGCGVSLGCWDLSARIRVEGEQVIWDEFEYPAPETGERTPCRGLAFVFDRAQYVATLERFRWQLQPEKRLDAQIHPDPEWGWSLYLSTFDQPYFPQTAHATLLVEGITYHGRIEDASRLFRFSPSDPVEAGWVKVQRLLHLPGEPTLLYTWLLRWFRAAWLAKHFAIPLSQPGIPVLLHRGLAPDSYQMEPKPDIYQALHGS